MLELPWIILIVGAYLVIGYAFAKTASAAEIARKRPASSSTVLFWHTVLWPVGVLFILSVAVFCKCFAPD